MLIRTLNKNTRRLKAGGIAGSRAEARIGLILTLSLLAVLACSLGSGIRQISRISRSEAGLSMTFAPAGHSWSRTAASPAR
ncbi:MAG TPA: hypothetical protein VE959_17380 [Bryobacteraceae bacterium]|nr:hypothetical protein [Bryobacteraceae bacterium]